ncbi:hypothetical protein ACSVI9_06360 [Pseudomonas aeruginosa]|uniref:hypothetical protein n=1 Tax=Pseudomonas aeruginosa TaxID=287 RepID=UPI000F52D3FD|nr:hypothetical protein [Pseudomonas aeruginosa]EME9747315.1 hypothetical protein [Pseudomonas aeruginosa]MBH4233350.1 hypothetical protein [Pseudomonas aeruginosa]MDU0578560.1 hypothetical protein [Pseudomonas aeruginosa]MDU0717199.1 hypothetical protein [Pseudomonas aeruginosa]RPT56605.1 hypothetical protein IPC962_05055 [Pseudomonas aeruginosa]
MSKTNNISIGSMHSSQVQQDAQHSSQYFDQSIQYLDLEAFLEAFSQDISQISDQVVAQSLRSDVETIKVQNSSPAPKKGIIKECLGSIRTVLEGATGNVLASYLPAVITLMGAL